MLSGAMIAHGRALPSISVQILRPRSLIHLQARVSWKLSWTVKRRTCGTLFCRKATTPWQRDMQMGRYFTAESHTTHALSMGCEIVLELCQVHASLEKLH